MRARSSSPALLLLVASVAMLLGGCLRHENDPGQGGLTIGENRELDEAAAMLEARPRASTPPSEAARAPQTNATPQPQTDAPAPPQQQPQRAPNLGGIGRAGSAPRNQQPPAQ